MQPETTTDTRHYPQFNVATALTWLRIAAIPAVAVVFYWPGQWSKPLSCLVFTLAGRVPARGEVISHPSGIEFRILDADPRRIRRLRARRVEAAAA